MDIRLIGIILICQIFSSTRAKVGAPASKHIRLHTVFQHVLAELAKSEELRMTTDLFLYSYYWRNKHLLLYDREYTSFDLLFHSSLSLFLFVFYIFPYFSLHFSHFFNFLRLGKPSEERSVEWASTRCCARCPIAPKFTKDFGSQDVLVSRNVSAQTATGWAASYFLNLLILNFWSFWLIVSLVSNYGVSNCVLWSSF